MDIGIKSKYYQLVYYDMNDTMIFLGYTIIKTGIMSVCYDVIDMNNTMIMKSAQLAAVAHQGQKRKWSFSHVPYIMHPMRVAGLITIRSNTTPEMVSAAWLHDTFEDTKLTIGEIRAAEIPDSVIDMVKGLTNPSKGSKLPRAERKAMDREHMVNAPWEVKFIKLADRMDNWMDIILDKATPQDFIETYRKETRLLLDVLKGTDPTMEMIINGFIE